MHRTHVARRTSHVDATFVCTANLRVRIIRTCKLSYVHRLQNELRISVLPIHLSYDAAWPVRKVPLRCTPHFITYHLESKTYCIALSQQRYTNVYFKFNGEDKVKYS